jgi:hypothetical protein
MLFTHCQKLSSYNDMCVLIVDGAALPIKIFMLLVAQAGADNT